MTAAKVQKTMKDNAVKFVDLRFTDTKGKEQHVTVPPAMVDAGFFKDGKMFDGSSIAAWKGILESAQTGRCEGQNFPPGQFRCGVFVGFDLGSN